MGVKPIPPEREPDQLAHRSTIILRGNANDLHTQILTSIGRYR